VEDITKELEGRIQKEIFDRLNLEQGLAIERGVKLALGNILRGVKLDAGPASYFGNLV
jgi:hypothetical protein